MKLRELMEKRARLVADMRSINDRPEGEAGDLSEVQDKRFTELRSDLEKTDSAIDRQKLIDEADRSAPGEALQSNRTGDYRAEVRARYSLTRALAGASGLDVDDGFERECSQEEKRRGAHGEGIAVPMAALEKRVLSSTSPAGGPGSNIIPTDHRQDQFIDLLRSKLVTSELGATVLSGLTGNVDIPKLKTAASAGWVAENAPISASDHEFAKVAMTPKHVGALTEFSRNMLLQSSPSIEDLIRSDFAAVLARELDRAALNGGGTNEPTGVLALSGIDTSVSMATPSWSAVLDLIDAVEEADSMVTGFVMRPKAAKTLRSELVAANTDSRFIMSSPDSLADYPAVRSTLVPNDLGTDNDKTAVIAGNWSDLIIGYWDSFSILVNPYESTAYSKGNVSVRAMLTADVAVRHAESFAAAIDFPTA